MTYGEEAVVEQALDARFQGAQRFPEADDTGSEEAGSLRPLAAREEGPAQVAARPARSPSAPRCTTPSQRRQPRRAVVEFQQGASPHRRINPGASMKGRRLCEFDVLIAERKGDLARPHGVSGTRASGAWSSSASVVRSVAAFLEAAAAIRCRWVPPIRPAGEVCSLHIASFHEINLQWAAKAAHLAIVIPQQ